MADECDLADIQQQKILDVAISNVVGGHSPMIAFENWRRQVRLSQHQQ